MKYDEEKVKPFLIRNYDRLRAIVEDKYQEQMETNFKTDDVAEIAAKVDALRANQTTIGRTDSYSSNTLGIFGNRNRTKSTFDISKDEDLTDKMLGGKKAKRSQSDFNLELAPKFGGAAAKKKKDGLLGGIDEEDEGTEDAGEKGFEGVNPSDGDRAAVA